MTFSGINLEVIGLPAKYNVPKCLYHLIPKTMYSGNLYK